jgi:uncharacterized protein YkwD
MGLATMPSATRLMASGADGPGDKSAKQATLKPVAADSSAPLDDDFQIEEQLLALANQSRQQAGSPPLTIDRGLSQAARIHAQAMLEARRLSHQFDGEPSSPNVSERPLNSSLSKREKMLRSTTTPSMDMNI